MYDIITKQAIACVSLNCISIATPNTRPAHRCKFFFFFGGGTGKAHHQSLGSGGIEALRGDVGGDGDGEVSD